MSAWGWKSKGNNKRMQPTLDWMEGLARQAGDILRGGLLTGYTVTHKGVIDLVTEMDHRSEEFLIGAVRQRYPDHRIISEEAGKLAGVSTGLWHIDPLDGTVNYAHGLPIFCVSIAYEEDGRVELGVVYVPLLDEMFSARRGKGATLNGKPIRVSQETKLDQSLLATGFPYDVRTRVDNNLNYASHFSLCSQGVRRMGAAAVDCCYVACGRLDGYWELTVKSYDVAAGGLIAEEAGAKVTTLQGNPNYLAYETSILAAPPVIHEQMQPVFLR